MNGTKNKSIGGKDHTKGQRENDSNKKEAVLRTQIRRECHNRAAEKKRSSCTQESRKRALRGSLGGSRMRHSKAMGAPRQHVRREVRIRVKLPVNYDAISGEVAKQDLRVICGTSCAKAYVPVRRSAERAPCCSMRPEW